MKLGIVTLTSGLAGMLPRREVQVAEGKGDRSLVRIIILLLGITFLASVSPANAYAPQPLGRGVYMPTHDGLHDATLLIIRHGEKDGLGRGLSSAGEMRAIEYADYFEHFKLDGTPVHIDALVASRDSRKSKRPRQTLEPFSRQSKIVIYQPSPNREVRDLVAWLKQRPASQTTLISWHHTKIPALLAALKIDPSRVLPNGKWPNDVFDWVVALHFDHRGHPIVNEVQLITEPDKVNSPVWAKLDAPATSLFNKRALTPRAKP